MVFTLCSKFIKTILPLPSFFKVGLPKDEEPNVFPVTITSQKIHCPICEGIPTRQDRTLRRFRHSYAWEIGVLWIEFFCHANVVSNVRTLLHMIMDSV